MAEAKTSPIRDTRRDDARLQDAVHDDAAQRIPAAPPIAPGLPLARAAELSIVVPTFNERANIVNVIAGVAQALPDVAWEIVFVDDNSPDDTASFVREIAQIDPHIRCLHRYGRRGLASACVEGIMSTAAPIVAVMDADGQHDERTLGWMFELLTVTDADIVVGTRYAEGGGVGSWDESRATMSRFATLLARWITGTTLSDPMSGFFMIRRDAFLASVPALSSIGFKILLDISASSMRPLKIVEVPYQFRSRQYGESKLDSMVLWEFFLLLLDKAVGRYVPARFISFALIGGSGVLLHLAVLSLLFKVFGASFVAAQTAATFAAITTNFLLNNTLTYRDQRLTGLRRLYGWISFNLVCGIGALANVGIANWLFASNSMWLASGLAGVAVGAVWNYAVSSIFTWNKK